MDERGNRYRKEDGQALVEFALVAPLVFALVFAIVQFGLTFNSYLVLTDAVRAGAREAAITHSTTAADGAVRKSGGGLDQAKLAVAVDPSSADWKPGSDVTVKATYPYAIDILGIVVQSGNLTSATTERIE
jgi:Flp pilus assembly protein TadG